MAPPRPYRTWSRSRGNRLPARAYPPCVPVHVTITTAGLRPFFRHPPLAAPVFAVVSDHPHTLAACLMPDHLHWLLRDGADLAQIVGQYKSFTTQIGWRLGVSRRLWQRSFWDHVVRPDEGLQSVVRYIVENPVRARLVDEVAMYPCQLVRCDRR